MSAMARANPGRNTDDLGIYVHWPFCDAICPYCDFNVRLNRNVDQAAWKAAFVKDIQTWEGLLPGRRVGSISFGGGTPSLMPPDTISAILDAIANIWQIAPDVEVSLEANPTSVEISQFREFARVGINRLSIGIQALDDQALKQLGRRHSSAEALEALSVANDVCDRVSFDLIYGRPGQRLSAWEDELCQALAIGGDHCSLYQLTVEPGTPFAYQASRGRLSGLPDDSLSAEFYTVTNSICSSRGLFRYEISNHSRLEGQSRHNRVYWEAGDWVGFGPGAHGRITLDNRRLEVVSDKRPSAWLNQVDRPALNEDAVDLQTAEEAAEEILFSGLRLSDGFVRSRLHRWGYDIPADRLGYLVDQSLLEEEGSHIRATSAGMLLIDAIVADLVPLNPL